MIVEPLMAPERTEIKSPEDPASVVRLGETTIVFAMTEEGSQLLITEGTLRPWYA
jgi:hypothetical protein